MRSRLLTGIAIALITALGFVAKFFPRPLAIAVAIPLILMLLIVLIPFLVRLQMAAQSRICGRTW